ncbi:hypothetical protein Hdeb2414_s0291g00858881 [Helianthus debilis subsp. tardiflorus]
MDKTATAGPRQKPPVPTTTAVSLSSVAPPHHHRNVVVVVVVTRIEGRKGGRMLRCGCAGEAEKEGGCLVGPPPPTVAPPPPSSQERVTEGERRSGCVCVCMFVCSDLHCGGMRK